MSTESNITVPDGFTLHTENTSHILRESNEAFLNPVQEFNRDTSVACIKVWSEELNRAKKERWRQNHEKKAKKLKEGATKKRKVEIEGAQVTVADDLPPIDAKPESSAGTQTKSPEPYKFVLLEALSATGLRSIRYAKEIPLLKHVIANDLSPSATAAMKRNIDINDLGPTPATDSSPEIPGKVRINEGDACTLMYSHREETNRVDVVDLDPYGTAAPFIDAAVQCVKDGVSLIMAESLSKLNTATKLYGRYIEPLVSLSIDFYVRIFVRVKTAPLEVKKALTKTSAYYICSTCQSHYEQPLGKVVEKASAAGNINYLFKIQHGPTLPQKCPECESSLHAQMAGPMWSGPIHDSNFVAKVLEHLEANQDKYGTAVRMKGMLTVAQEASLDPI
ncbi:hypothetical protein DXG03_006647 [Asterophora parasitica]|uniref:tRNA (guanine(26)-N(2))-dimethyltransferase n=1 Tax=Asterophora parasitica TaxID=117018 RepID=A0A9P7G9G3_9AGAR|nr:hypothetical protein DXG03_006647 [Asterophora parasitica]